jgi:tRNA 2-thiouridine synthesizing protein A
MKEHRVDAKGKPCPQPIVETSRAVKNAESGDLVIVEATDEGFYNDIKSWCEKTGNQLVSLDKRITFYVAVIRAK